ncbi:hypothetical protein GX51_07929 [Blastomyces parvus]|uniref:Uncharacterized protein n=1 Tax=Blastomyces parvus TaxID=2060905 RepID=A0A2B7W9J9_9EURO|nr:hypothetical protein GX51_07929 [Blastomyces parvus]
MQWDKLAEKKSQSIYAAWLHALLQQSPALPLELASKLCCGFQATRASDFTTGAFNMCCTVTFEDGFNALVSVQHDQYHLYCDDLHPSNVLVTESDLKITDVID